VPFGRSASVKANRQTKRAGTRALGVPAGTKPLSVLLVPDDKAVQAGAVNTLRHAAGQPKAPASAHVKRIDGRAAGLAVAAMHAAA
jgi:hypothetical protein